MRKESCLARSFPTKGFGLIELLAGLTIGAIVITAATYLFNSSNKALMTSQKSTELNSSILSCARHIQRVGRTAQSCQRVVEGGFGVLECQIDRSNPPSGTTVPVRFRPDGGSVFFEERTGSPPAWVQRMRYLGISKAEFCGEAEMTGGTCQVPGAGPHLMLPSIAARPRLFRFQVVGSLGDSAEKIRSYQGAFFVRNPSPFSGFAYQW